MEWLGPPPGEERATGIAFDDGTMKTWKDTLSPSFVNIIKNVLVSSGDVPANAKLPQVLSQIEKLKLLRKFQSKI